MEPKQTNCPNCGAVLPFNGKCEYCGTIVHLHKYDPITVERRNVAVIRHEAAVKISQEAIFYAEQSGYKDDMMNGIKRQLTEQLVKSLIESGEIDIKSWVNPVDMTVGIFASLDVAKTGKEEFKICHMF